MRILTIMWANYISLLRRAADSLGVELKAYSTKQMNSRPESLEEFREDMKGTDLQGTDFIVVDTVEKRGFLQTDLALQVAQVIDADYYPVDALKSDFLYKQLGFRNIPDLIHEDIPQEFFLALPFSDKIPQGVVLFHKGFQATSQEECS